MSIAVFETSVHFSSHNATRVRFLDGEGATPLHIAAQEGHKEMCEFLLGRGATHQQNASGETPLYLAAQGGHTEVCELLLDRGATHKPRRDGTTPLLIAALNNFEDTCRLLLVRGAAVLHARRLKSWRELIGSNRLSPAMRTAIAQRAPHLFFGRSTILPTSVRDLIFATHTMRPDMPRRAVLDVIYREIAAKQARGTPPEVFEVIALFSSQPRSFFDLNAGLSPARQLAVARGLQVRKAWGFSKQRTGPHTARHLPAWIWTNVLVSRYGIPEAWTGEVFWTSPSGPCAGPIIFLC
jgi:hypothetical protein